MYSFWGIIPKYINKNKKRVLFIGASIIISIALIISMSFIKEALRISLYNKMVDDIGGSFDYMVQSDGDINYESLKNEKEIEHITLTREFGNVKIPNSKYSMKMLSYEKNIIDLLNFKLIEGKYPNKENEIAIEKWVLDSFQGEYKIGDKIKLDYINPRAIKVEDMSKKDDLQEFIIVGTFNYIYNKNMNFNKGVAYTSPEFVNTLLKQKVIDKVEETAYFTIKPQYSSNNAIKRIVATNKYNNLNFIKNHEKYNYEKSNEKYNYILGSIFFIISIISSIIIYNIFNVSVAERRKEFGMIRAVGCPPWKIKAMVVGEGLIMGIIFIPIGIIVGTYATKGVLKFVTGIGNLGRISDIPVNVFIISILIGIIMIMLGSYFPARNAAKISPIEAISYKNNLTLKENTINIRLKEDNFIGRKLKLETNMAILNLMRNKNRFITTCISIILTTTLFIIVNYIIQETNPVAIFKQGFDGEFKVFSKTWITEEKAKEIRNIEGVDKITTSKETYTSLQINDKEKITKEGLSYIKQLSESNSAFNECLEGGRYIFPLPCISYKPEELEKLKAHLVSGEIDVDKMQKEPIVVLGQNLNGYEDTNLEVGDNISLWCKKIDEGGNIEKAEIQNFIIGAIVDEDAFKNLSNNTRNTIILSETIMEKYMWIDGYQRINIFLDKNVNYNESKDKIHEVLKNVRGVQLSEFKDEIKKIEIENKQIVLAMYIVVLVVAIVSIINLISIMSMNAIVRKQEFGIMRAMGLSKNQVKKIIIKEGIIYGVVSGIISIILALIISIIIANKSKQLFQQEIIWSFPFINIISTFISVIIIITMIARITSKTLYKDSIVESIRSID